jgi:transcriptional regulator with XRE-family HTH domain
MGMSQATVAASSNFARPYLGAIEDGLRNLTTQVLWDLSLVLGRPFSDLMAEAEARYASFQESGDTSPQAGHDQ